MAKPTEPAPFVGHLYHLRDARRQTDEAVRLLGKAHKHANEALGMTWQLVFDHLSHCEMTELADINTIAGVIFKLAQSAHRLKTMEQETRDYEEQLSAHRAAAERARNVLAQNPGLPMEIREQLERELNLMS
jgi:uncharacterized heparinase superfamily protein